MTRKTTFEIPTDTSLFTPIQLQPRAAFTLAMTAWARWLREHWVPFPRLIKDYGLGVVIAGLDLEYSRPFTFFDSDALVATTSLSVRDNGKLLFLDLSLCSSHGEEVARVAAVLRPVEITDGLILSAAPTTLSPEIIALFDDDEIVNVSRPRLGVALAELADGPPAMASAERSITVHRHLCEAADQWSGIALADIATESREQLAAARGGDLPELAAAFMQPMRRIAVEFRRPAFFLDEMRAQCTAFVRANSLVFVHQLLSAFDGEALAAFGEWFPLCPVTVPEPSCFSDHEGALR